MLTLSDVRLRRGPRVLVDGDTCSIFRGEQAGIVGRNGCGKSTLLALIRGELAPDAGDYRAQRRRRKGDAQEGLIAASRLAMLHAEYDRLGGYAARYQR